MKKKTKKRAVLHVLCPACGLHQFDTTSQYRPDKSAHPGMLKQIEPYESWGWDGVPPDPTSGYGCMECGECGSMLAPAGHLKVEAPE